LFPFLFSINTRAVICLKKLKKCSVVFVFLPVICEVVAQLRIGKLAHFEGTSVEIGKKTKKEE